MSINGRRRSDSGITSNSVPRALLVDDDPGSLAYIAAMVRRAGFDAELASDGAAALEMLNRSHFDLLVIDYEMPRLSGLDLIPLIRTSEKSRDAYVVMLTGRTDLETKILALTSGYDNFLTKASTEVEILASLAAAERMILRQKKLDADMGELYRLAVRDELTGLPNRRFFDDEAGRLLESSREVGIVIFDLDDFKLINDTLGHPVGDVVLRDVGSQFRRGTRSQDLVARYGGDEFVMVIADLALPAVEVIARRLVSEIEALRWRVGEREISTKASIGIAASALLEDPTIPRLLEVADRDLYKTKWMRKHPEKNPELYEYPPLQGERIRGRWPAGH